jgi:uncharacterized membrane protein YfcA
VHLSITVIAVLLILIGLVAGTAGSLVGLGGGFVMVPLMTFLFPDMAVNPKLISGTSMAVLFFNSISSTAAYAKQKRIDYRTGITFALFSVPGSIIGAKLVNDVPAHAFYVSFGIFLLLISLFMLFKPDKTFPLPFRKSSERHLIDAKGNEFRYSFNMPFGATVAFFVGFVSSLFGIGGGSVMVPTMTLLLGFPAHIAGATSLFMILLTAFVATLSDWYFGNIVWGKVLFLALGAILGGQLGAKLAPKIPAKRLLQILSLILIFTALRLIFKH